ncbi:MAG: biopolymer transporter ExbD, partial [Cyanobacteria bacterium P01_A01_bin.105]
INREPIQVNDLQAAIEQQLNAGQTAVVTIHADEQAFHGQVVEVMDQVRQIEGAKLAIATRSQD